MFFYIVLPLIFMIPLGIYMYFFIRRILGLLMKSKKVKQQKIISLVLTLIIMIPALKVWGTWAVVVFHIVIIAWAVELVYFIVKEFTNNSFIKVIYRSGIIPLSLTAILIVYGYINVNNIIEKDYTVYTNKNIRSEGYRVDFISDLHFGTTMDNETLQKYCDKISKTNADVVILGGDIVDESTTLKQMQDAFKILSTIKSNYGVYYVYGNHDKSTYTVDPNYTEEELEEAIINSGIKILADDIYEINDELCIIGRKDRSDSEERKSAQDLVSEFNKDYYTIIVDHQPCEINENSENGYDLMLSGHTHFGQIWPLGHLMNLFKINEMNYGYERVGNMDIIVSSGMGGWGYPIRTEKKCEYLIINIVKEINFGKGRIRLKIT